MSSVTAQFPRETGPGGEFRRQTDAFRDLVSPEGAHKHPVVAGRYHLYVSLACPWAHRTLIVRQLLGLTGAIGVTVVDPVRDEEHGWAFRDGPGHTRDRLNGFQYLREAYLATDPHFDGRPTVPVLWDTIAKRIVNNSEDDICRMFHDVFGPTFGGAGAPDLFPGELRKEQDALNAFLYERVNNGVYRAGFATRQDAYDRAVHALFEALDQLEQRLAVRRFLLGPHPVESDWRLFCTLVRFDAVYHGHFKCNLRRISDYPNLGPYLRDLYQQPGIAATVDFDHIKRHYYASHGRINPTRIVPAGPLLDLALPHGRDRLRLGADDLA